MANQWACSHTQHSQPGGKFSFFSDHLASCSTSKAMNIKFSTTYWTMDTSDLIYNLPLLLPGNEATLSNTSFPPTWQCWKLLQITQTWNSEYLTTEIKEEHFHNFINSEVLANLSHPNVPFNFKQLSLNFRYGESCLGTSKGRSTKSYSSFLLSNGVRGGHV